MYSCFSRLFQHLAWADREIISALDQPNNSVDAAIQLLAHIVAAEHIWLSRIHSQDIGDFTPWTRLSFPECRDLSAKNLLGYLTLVENITEQQLQNLIVYRTTKGDEFRSPLGEIFYYRLHSMVPIIADRLQPSCEITNYQFQLQTL